MWRWWETLDIFRFFLRSLLFSDSPSFHFLRHVPSLAPSPPLLSSLTYISRLSSFLPLSNPLISNLSITPTLPPSNLIRFAPPRFLVSSLLPPSFHPARLFCSSFLWFWRFLVDWTEVVSNPTSLTLFELPLRWCHFPSGISISRYSWKMRSLQQTFGAKYKIYQIRKMFCQT